MTLVGCSSAKLQLNILREILVRTSVDALRWHYTYSTTPYPSFQTQLVRWRRGGGEEELKV